MEEIARVDTSSLEESICLLLDLITKVKVFNSKLCSLLNCLIKILTSTDQASQVWRNVLGFNTLLDLLVSMEGLFTDTNAIDANINNDNDVTYNNDDYNSRYNCMEALIKCLAIDFTLFSFDK